MITATTTEEKLAKIQEIADCSLHMRSPGDWYLSCDLDVMTENGALTSEPYDGKNPDEAIEAAWKHLTNCNSSMPRMVAVAGNIYLWQNDNWFHLKYLRAV